MTKAVSSNCASAVALAACAFLAGCQTGGGITTPRAPELVTPEAAMIMPPPGAFAMVGVVQQDYSNGLEQTVWLKTASSVAGQNYLKIRYVGGTGKDARPSLAYNPLTPQTLRREQLTAVPGVRLAATNNFLRNAYGPLGYASGRSGSGDACLFGWQQIRSRAAPSGIGRDFGMIQVRARLCDQTATERELLNVMYGYTITGTFAGEIWNPYGSAQPVSPLLAYAGQQILPPENPVPATYSFGYRAPAEAPAARSQVVAVTTRPSEPVRAAPLAAPEATTEPARPDIHIPLPDTLTGTTSQTQGRTDIRTGFAEPPPSAKQDAAHAPSMPLVPMPDCLASATRGTGCTARQ